MVEGFEENDHHQWSNDRVENEEVYPVAPEDCEEQKDGRDYHRETEHDHGAPKKLVEVQEPEFGDNLKKEIWFDNLSAALLLEFLSEIAESDHKIEKTEIQFLKNIADYFGIEPIRI